MATDATSGRADADLRWFVPDDRHRKLDLPDCPDWCSGDPTLDDGEYVCVTCYLGADCRDRLPVEEVVIDTPP